MSLSSRTLNNTFWQSAGVLYQAAAQLVVVGVLAHLLEPSDFGLIAVANLVIGLVSQLNQFGFSQAIIQKKNLTDVDSRVAFSVSLSSALLMMGSVWLTAPMFGQFFRNPDVVRVLRILSFSFFLTNLGIVAEALLVRRLDFKKLFWVSFFTYSFGYVLVGITLAVLGYGVWALVNATLVVRLLRSIILVLIQPHPKQPSFSKQELYGLLRYGGGITISALLKYLANNGDYFVVGRWLGVISLGIYQQAFNIVVTFSRYLGDILEKVLFATASRIQGETLRLTRSYLFSLTAINYLLLPISLVILVLAPEIVRVYLGDKWMDAILPAQILAIGLTFRSQSRISDAFVNAMGSVYKVAARKIVFAMTIILGSLIGQQWGVAGVAIAVTIAMTLDYLLVLDLGLRVMNVGWKRYFAEIFPSVIVGCLVFLSTLISATFLRNWVIGSFWVLIGSFFSTLLIVILVAGSYLVVFGTNKVWFIQTLLMMLPPKAGIDEIATNL